MNTYKITQIQEMYTAAQAMKDEKNARMFIEIDEATLRDIRFLSDTSIRIGDIVVSFNDWYPLSVDLMFTVSVKDRDEDGALYYGFWFQNGKHSIRIAESEDVGKTLTEAVLETIGAGYKNVITNTPELIVAEMEDCLVYALNEYRDKKEVEDAYAVAISGLGSVWWMVFLGDRIWEICDTFFERFYPILSKRF